MIKRWLAPLLVLLCITSVEAAQKTQAQLSAEITSNFPSCGTACITATNLRTVFQDVVDSYFNVLASQAANLFLASPNGASGNPVYRAIAGPDVPPINLAAGGNGGVTGVLPVANGGSGQASVAANTFFAGPNGSGGAPSFRTVVAPDINGLAPSFTSLTLTGAVNTLLTSVGNTPTLVAGTSLYPTNTGGGGTPHYDANSNLVANVIGAKYGLFGIAAKDGVQWPNTYISGIDAAGGIPSVYGVSTTGNYGGAFASRSSDSAVVGANIIGGVNLGVGDNTTVGKNQLIWGSYSVVYLPASSSYFGAIGHEVSMNVSTADGPLTDPFNTNPTAAATIFRADCGAGASPLKCSSMVSLLNNGAKSKSGIVFGNQALDTGAGLADAVAMPPNYSFTWYSAAATQSWRLLSNSGAVDGQDQQTLGAHTWAITLKAGAFSPISVDQNGVVASAIRAGGSAPTGSGACAINTQVGGNTAGSFKLNGACASTIILTFAETAAVGWACTAADMTTGAATIRQTAYTTTTATYTMTGGVNLDQLTFACTGF